MADAAIFIGWGEPARGREAKSLEVFNEAVQLWGKLAQDGRIESFDVALLEPHGGDLGGFALLRGSREQLDAVRASDDVQRVNTRAALVVDRFGFVDAHVGDGLGRQMALYHQQVGDLT